MIGVIILDGNRTIRHFIWLHWKALVFAVCYILLYRLTLELIRATIHYVSFLATWCTFVWIFLYYIVLLLLGNIIVQENCSLRLPLAIWTKWVLVTDLILLVIVDINSILRCFLLTWFLLSWCSRFDWSWVVDGEDEIICNWFSVWILNLLHLWTLFMSVLKISFAAIELHKVALGPCKLLVSLIHSLARLNQSLVIKCEVPLLNYVEV